MPTESKLADLARQGCPVFYFYSSEGYLVRQAVRLACRVLAGGEEVTVLDGAAPQVEQLIMAAGTISFFGTRRVVCLPELDPGAYGEKDLEAFMDTVASLENAVLVLGSVFEADRTGKPRPGKRAQRLVAQCKKLGYAEEMTRPGPTELLERCGEDPYLLENEVDKLAALSGYQTITPAMVAEAGVVSLEADVFEMVRMVTGKNAAAACKKLHILLRLGQEPIAITAAMIGSYVDLYRVKLGQQNKKNYSAVFKDFGYKGSDYRLKKSAQTAAGYTLPQLKACLQVLLELDQALKSQPVSPQVLLETALCRLAMAGGSQ